MGNMASITQKPTGRNNKDWMIACDFEKSGCLSRKSKRFATHMTEKKA